MHELLMVLALALLPALGNVVGGLLAEAFTISRLTLSLTLHAAAGVALAVVAVKLMPQALQAEPSWLVVAAFAAGGVSYVGLDAATGILERGSRPGAAGSWLLFVGVATDVLSDGLMVGIGSGISFGLGLLLSLAQLPANVPGGLAVIASFKERGMGRVQRVLVLFGFLLPAILGATLGYWGVRGRPIEVQYALLAFTSGMLTTVVVEEMGPQADRYADVRLAALSFVAGFASFMLLSTSIG